MQEIENMTRIVDPQNTIKDEKTSKDLKETLSRQWQTKYKMETIDENIIKKLHITCNGNPLLTLEYFVNML